MNVREQTQLARMQARAAAGELIAGDTIAAAVALVELVRHLADALDAMTTIEERT